MNQITHLIMEPALNLCYQARPVGLMATGLVLADLGKSVCPRWLINIINHSINITNQMLTITITNQYQPSLLPLSLTIK